MKRLEKRKLLALFLALCIFTGSSSAFAEEFDEEDIIEEENEIVE